MYNQQEIEMVRRQTIQIETEKRALMRTIAIATSIACGVCLALAAFFAYLYVSGRMAVTGAEGKIAASEDKYRKTNEELQKKTAELEKRAQVAAGRKQRFDELLSKAMGNRANGVEIGELAKEIYDSPQKVVEVQGIPPSSLTRWYKHRTNDKTYTFSLISTNLEGKNYLYSILMNIFVPPQSVVAGGQPTIGSQQPRVAPRRRLAPRPRI
jgi:hypothetical protein